MSRENFFDQFRWQLSPHQIKKYAPRCPLPRLIGEDHTTLCLDGLCLLEEPLCELNPTALDNRYNLRTRFCVPFAQGFRDLSGKRLYLVLRQSNSSPYI